MEKQSVLERSTKKVDHIWYPFTQAMSESNPIMVKTASGASVTNDKGEKFIDAISSWWATLHGHSHPYIQQAIKKQLESLEHVMLANCTHAPAIELSNRLINILPEGYEKVFFSDNGSTAVETALKVAIQYWFNNSLGSKKTIIAFYDGYHGETFGSMSVSQRGIFNNAFENHLFDVQYILPPIEGFEEESCNQLLSHLKKCDVAAFIFEPWIQGVSGMKKHTLKGLDQLLEICREHDVLSIADEVMTGMGRLGPNFVSELLKTTPDIICLAKSLTSGFLPLGATIFRKGIFENFLSVDRSKAFLHGHTYCGNPLACAAAIASLELLETKQCIQQRKEIEASHHEFSKSLVHPSITSSDVTGTLLAITCQSSQRNNYYNKMRNTISNYFINRKILIRPLGNSFHILPPYCIEKEELATIYNAIESFFKEDYL